MGHLERSAEVRAGTQWLTVGVTCTGKRAQQLRSVPCVSPHLQVRAKPSSVVTFSTAGVS